MIERRQRRRRDLVSAGKIGKYSIEEAIRRQPTRTLYRAHDPFLDRNVAIKIIQLFDPGEDQDDQANESFFSEAKAIGRLQHQNIVSVYDAGVGDYEGYLVMEYVQGESLLQKLKRQKTLPLREALDIATQICRALDFANIKGVIHRDIKPSNIMLTKQGEVKVVDFGVSVLASHIENDQAALMGTPSYIAPELVHGVSPSIQTDLYSLAVLLYEMILGRLPFEGDDAHAVLFKVINQEMQSITENIPEAVKVFLTTALDKDPRQRFSSCEEFESQLNDLNNDVDKIQHDEILDEAELQQLQVFEDCTADVLHQLSTCIMFENVRPGEILISEDVLDEYVGIVRGKALLVGSDQHIIVNEGRWLIEKNLLQGAASYSCKALTNSLLLRVSKSNLLETSQATQAYFYRFLVDRIFIKY